MAIMKSIQSKYKRDNAAYKKSRRERGNFLLYVDHDLVNTWYNNGNGNGNENKGRGRPNKYSDLSITIIFKFYYLILAYPAVLVL